MNQGNINWKELEFSFHPTDGYVVSDYKNNSWSTPRFVRSMDISIPIASTCLHYGQEAFEGLKAYAIETGGVNLFRIRENAKRMIASADRIVMKAPPVELFEEMVLSVIRENKAFIPPYGFGASLYIRPLLIGTSQVLGVKPSPEYTFLIFVSPVGSYFKGGMQSLDVKIERNFDRAATRGTGHVKVGGNYAASLLPGMLAQEEGYKTLLYLDSQTQEYLDESGPANFFGIKNNTYVTPLSNSILPSITNDSLITLAQDLGMKVERRHIPVTELDTFEEVGACGTAAVITPIRKIVDGETVYKYGDTIGKRSSQLYKTLTGIQNGTVADKHGWIQHMEV